MKTVFDLLVAPLAIALAGVIAGVFRARQLRRAHGICPLATAHRLLPEVCVLAPLSIVATTLLLVLLRIPRVAWVLPPLLDYWREPILWVLSSGSLAYLCGVAVRLAFDARDPERNKLFASSLVLLSALGWMYLRSIWPIADSLQNWQMPGGYVFQSSSYSCGAASLANAARAFGIPATERQMAELAGTTHAGTSPGQILHALRQIGLRGIKRTFTFDELRQVRNPCILLVEYPGTGPDSHAVVLLPPVGPRLRIIDPLDGAQEWAADRLYLVWRGHLIECVRPSP